MILNEQTKELDTPLAIRMLADFLKAEMDARLRGFGSRFTDQENVHYATLQAMADDCTTLIDAKKLGLPVPDATDETSSL